MNALLTDFYQLTMAAGYFEAGKQHDQATFELFARRLPSVRQHLVVAGLHQAVEYLERLRFQADEIAWLRSLPQFSRVDEAFWVYLRDFRFTGTVFAMPEGTLAYANEPLLSVRAPLIEAQLVETFLLATIGFQTMIASAAARIVEAAEGRGVVEFGTRRAHSPQAGLYAARAAYIGGCIGTSNTLAGFQFGIPVFGTAAHSWVLSFADEREAFARLQQLLGERCVYLIDTHDTLTGARQAVALGRPLWGVRLDSGDLVTLSREVRQILDQAGLTDAKIMATNELDEAKIRAVVEARAPIDSFGVGTALATSSDAPSLGMVYKLVEISSNGQRRDVAKHSPEKQTVPGAKQVFRYDGLDVIARADECQPLPGECRALLQPVMMNGERLGDLPWSRLDRFPLPQPQGTRLSDSLEALGH
ncbi:MAG: nicotinate phosphoribosyltransferase [Acidobacteria bacterium]|nr:nicotinate phosphoribosyltransferase [Acidobacteriota bacterium]